jgi:hypothetical protein
MRTVKEIRETIEAIEEVLPYIVEGTVTEALYVGQLSTLKWALGEEK